MAVLKSIIVNILGGDGTTLFSGVANHTLAFPPQFVGRMMEAAIEGFTLEEEDHAHLNNLHLNGSCRFFFGSDWQYLVEAKVVYDI